MICMTMMTQSCTKTEEQAQNPFLVQQYETPYGTAPFHLIEAAHYEPAMQEGMAAEDQEIADIVNNPEAPTFANTIVPYANSGAMLNRVLSVFYNLMEAETNDTLQEIAQRMSPMLTEHGNNISLNPELFKRVKAVYDTQKDDPALKPRMSASSISCSSIQFSKSSANWNRVKGASPRGDMPWPLVSMAQTQKSWENSSIWLSKKLLSSPFPWRRIRTGPSPTQV